MKGFKALLQLCLARVVFADWTSTKWDAIVVGAGPAGIIGTSNKTQPNYGY